MWEDFTQAEISFDVLSVFDRLQSFNDFTVCRRTCMVCIAHPITIHDFSSHDAPFGHWLNKGLSNREIKTESSKKLKC